MRSFCKKISQTLSLFALLFSMLSLFYSQNLFAKDATATSEAVCVTCFNSFLGKKNTYWPFTCTGDGNDQAKERAFQEAGKKGYKRDQCSLVSSARVEKIKRIKGLWMNCQFTIECTKE